MNTPRRSAPDTPLRRARKRAGLTQLQLSVAAGRGCLTTVSLAERGGKLSDEMAERFAAVLGCRPDDLKIGDEEKERSS
jgi:transcriptional regulator with XRE-family HTH domain